MRFDRTMKSNMTMQRRLVAAGLLTVPKRRPRRSDRWYIELPSDSALKRTQGNIREILKDAWTVAQIRSHHWPIRMHSAWLCHSTNAFILIGRDMMISVSCEAVALGKALINLQSPKGCDWRPAAFIPRMSCLSLVYRRGNFLSGGNRNHRTPTKNGDA